MTARIATTAPAKPPLAYFAARLRAWRIERGLYLKQVAADFGVTEATWSRWEKQQRFPSPDNLRLLAEFIGVPICCFFYPDASSCPDCHCATRHHGRNDHAAPPTPKPLRRQPEHASAVAPARP